MVHGSFGWPQHNEDTGCVSNFWEDAEGFIFGFLVALYILIFGVLREAFLIRGCSYADGWLYSMIPHGDTGKNYRQSMNKMMSVSFISI